MKLTALLSLVVTLTACSVGDRYVIAPETLAAVQALSPEQRAKTAVPAHRIKNDQAADVRASALSLGEAVTRPDGRVAIPTHMPSRRIVLGSTLVWIGTPLSVAGLAMVIFTHGTPRYAGIALAGVAEPVMIAGTVLWVQGTKAHPQEVDKNVADLTYLPEPGAPPGLKQ